jgi:hypothetical protein
MDCRMGGEPVVSHAWQSGERLRATIVADDTYMRQYGSIVDASWCLVFVTVCLLLAINGIK